MTLAQPAWLLLWLLLPAIAWLSSARQPGGLPLSTFRLLSGLVPARPRRWPQILLGLRLLALAVLIVALARPQGEGRWIEEKRYGIDIMLALDISGSMRAEDFQPANRIEAAKHVLKEFIARNAENRIGLVAFAGRSLTLCPLTTDTRTVSDLVDRISFDTVDQDGTAIGDGIGNCLYRLEDRSAKSRIIVLLSDGENNSGYLQPLDAARMAASRRVRIYTVAVGKPGGAPIPLVDAFGRRFYVRNRDGSLFLPQIDEATLARIAQVTGGRYFRATDTPALESAYREIASLERSEMPVQRHRIPTDLSGAWIAFGLLLLASEFALSTGLASILRGRVRHA